MKDEVRVMRYGLNVVLAAFRCWGGILLLMGCGMGVESPVKVLWVGLVPDLERTARTEVEGKMDGESPEISLWFVVDV